MASRVASFIQVDLSHQWKIYFYPYVHSPTQAELERSKIDKKNNLPGKDSDHVEKAIHPR